MKASKPEYLDRVQSLTREERERLFSRMSGKLPRRLEKDKLSPEEALAIQLELEDEHLQEWREKMHALKEKNKSDKPKSANVKKPATKLAGQNNPASTASTAVKPAAKPRSARKPPAAKS